MTWTKWVPWVLAASMGAGFLLLAGRVRRMEAELVERELEVRAGLEKLSKSQRATEAMARRTLSEVQATVRTQPGAALAVAREAAPVHVDPALLDPGSDEETADELTAEERAEAVESSRREQYRKVSDAIAVNHADPAWARSVQNSVEAVAAGGKARVDAFRCGGAFCSFTIKADERAVFGNPGTGLALKVAEHAEYVAYLDRKDGNVDVVIAKHATDVNAL